MTETRPLLPRPKNLKHAVANHIREQVFSGNLRPGSKIDQEALADVLGVSKLPVREALISLEAEALVVNVPRRGSYVADLTPDDVRDHYRIYGLVSAVAAERAAERLTDSDLEEMRRMLAEMERSKDPARLEQLNHEFHRAINRSGGSQRLYSVLRLLADSIPPRFYEFTTGWSAVAHADHTRIFDALRGRDAEAARDAMVEHLREGGERAVVLLDQAGFWRDRDGQGSP